MFNSNNSLAITQVGSSFSDWAAELEPQIPGHQGIILSEKIASELILESGDIEHL
jgi:hypothetical protein